MRSENVVPIQLFDFVNEQLYQALQMIAALTLSDDEVIACVGNNYDDKDHLIGWASSMKEDLLNDHGKTQLIDMLSRYGFLTNSHAGFIYGAFERPPINEKFLEYAGIFTDAIKRYEDGEEEDVKNPNDLVDHFRNELYKNGASKEDFDSIYQLIGTNIFIAACRRNIAKRNV